MILLHCLIALVMTAISYVQPADAGGGIEPGVERGSAEPQGVASPRMRAAAQGLSPAPRVWGYLFVSDLGFRAATRRFTPALFCSLLRRLEPGSHSAAAGGIQGEGVKSKQPPQGKQQGNPQPDKPKPTPTLPIKKETTVQWLLRFLGLSATPGTMKGEAEDLTGDLWLYDVQRGVGQRITRQGGFRSPIVLVGDAKLLALKGEQVVEIAIEGGDVKPRATIPGIVKLIGVNADANQALFLCASDDRRFSAGAFSLNGDASETRELDDRGMLAYLRGWERVYEGGKTVVCTKTETKDGVAGTMKWRDVYLKRKGRDTINVSHCDGVNCGQPSLSPSGRFVVYVRAR